MRTLEAPISAQSDTSASRLERYRGFDEVNRPYLRWQLEQFEPYLGRRILEVGCGLGGILELIEDAELVYGIDVEAEVLAHAARRCGHRPECRFRLADLTCLSPEDRAELAEQRFDTVLAINVLEHIRDDLGALLEIERLLRPGGILALLVPAHIWLYGPYDRADGHYRRYGKRHLEILLSHTRLRPIRIRYLNAPGALAWWVRYRLLRRSTLEHGQLGAMAAVLPLIRAFERIIPPPFGLSVVAVCRLEPDPAATASSGEGAPRRPR